MSLSEEDILNFVSQAFDIRLSRDVLTNPSQKIVSELYTLFLTDFGLGAFASPDLTATEGIENLERYDEFMYNWNLVRGMQYVLRKTGFPTDFTLLDLIRPRRKKNVLVLNHLIVAWSRLAEVKERWEEEQPSLQNMAKKREEQLAKIESLKILQEKKMVQVMEARRERPEYEKKLTALNEDLVRKREAANQLGARYRSEKKELSDKKEELAELEVEIRQLREEIATLEAQIVRSPEKIMAETEEIEAQLESKMQDKRRLNHEYTEALSQAETVEKALSALNPSMDSLRDTFADLEGLKDKAAAVDCAKGKRHQKEMKLQEQKVILEENKKIADKIKEETKGVEKKHQMKMKPILSLNEEIKVQIEKKQSGENQASDEVNCLLEEERRIMKEMDETKIQRKTVEETFDKCVTRVGQAMRLLADTVNQNIPAKTDASSDL